MFSIPRQFRCVRYLCVPALIEPIRLPLIACLLVAMTTHEASSSFAAAPLFAAPQPTTSGDEIFLVSTREVGTAISGQRLNQGLRCKRFVGDRSRQTAWQDTDWRELAARSRVNRRTVIYVHGNRVAPGRDVADGLAVYRSLKLLGKSPAPVRFIIWSWPSAPIPGRVKDFRVKATLTDPVAWQFAWFLNQFPAEAQLSLVGYSYGARVVSGAMHLLGGGRIGMLKLNDSAQQKHATVRAALIAAAFDETWIEGGNYYGRTIWQTERLIVSTNKQDPVMRFYHLSNGRGRVHALGRAGIERLSSLGAAARRIKHVDFTDNVGRSHTLEDYLAATSKMSTVWHQLLSQDAGQPVGRVASLIKMLPWVK